MEMDTNNKQGLSEEELKFAKQQNMETEVLRKNSNELMTLRDEREELLEEFEHQSKLKRRWLRTAVILLIILIIILLYSCALYMRRGNIKVYNAVYTADMLMVDKSTFDTMTTEEILAASREDDLVSNCMEFYYDPDDDVAYDLENAGGSTKYYSIRSLDAAIVGQPLNYNLTSLKEIADKKQAQPSVTQVMTKVFQYGLRDGSCQTAAKGSDVPIFSGYCKTLVDKYHEKAEIVDVDEEAVALAVTGDIEVTEEMAQAIVDGVLEDAYMDNSYVEKTDDYAKAEDMYYGFIEENGRIYYIKSHAAAYSTKSRQVVEQIDVTESLKSNLQAYLGQDVKVSTKIPYAPKNDCTVIYLTTENYAFDNFHIAELNKAY